MVALEEVLGRLEGVKKAGDGYLAKCPAHNDAHASLSIARGDRVPILVNCKACGAGAVEIESALGYSRGDFTRREPGPTTQAGRQLVATYTYRNDDGSLFARKERLLDDVGGKSFRWSRPDPDDLAKRIPGTKGEIPLYRAPELLGAPADELVLIVEGEKDADRLASLGFVVTTTPNGASAKWREADSRYFAGRKVCIIGDDDAPGRKKAEETAAALRDVAMAVGVLVLPNPNRIKGFDASDFLDAGGQVAELRTQIEKSFAPRMPAEVVPAEELEARVLRLWTEGDERGVFPGWRRLEGLYRPRLGELTILTGVPNSGKSTFVDDMMVRIACGDEELTGQACAGWRWLVYSAEQGTPERHAKSLLRKLLGKPFDKGPSARMSEPEIRAGLQLLQRHFTMINPTVSSCGLDRILEIAYELNRRAPFQGLLIDPYNTLAAISRDNEKSEHEFINAFLSKLRTFAQAERVHVIVVAHPTKLAREEGQTELPVVRPYAISGSAHWFNHADAILSLWRPMRDLERAQTGEVEVHSLKIRFQPECGQLGMTRLFFDRVSTRYLERPAYHGEQPDSQDARNWCERAEEQSS